MSTSSAPLSEADYDAIESAVMETMRGRWFLAEYGRRNRSADTRMLLSALDRIEASLRGESSVQSVDRIRFDIVEMAKTIARTKAEIAAIKPDAEHQGKFGEATEELDSIVHQTETATSDILAAAEQIQEVAWTLREQGLEAEVCDMLDTRATDLYTACSFQDLTGQRTKKVINVLRYLEERINAMIRIWGLEGAMAAETAEREAVRDGDKALLNGPALPGRGLDQGDVDLVMRPADTASAPSARVPPPRNPEAPAPVAPAAPEPVEAQIESYVEQAEASPEPTLPEAAQPAAVAAPEPQDSEPPAEPLGPPLQPAMESLPAAEQRPAAEERPARPSFPHNDPLAAVAALSYEEKVALFT
jgi:chemotaxis protein CheZ